MNYLDGFSGYGGFHLAFEQAGWNFDKVYFSEIDKHAIANYSYNFPNSIYAGSIDTICESGIISELDLFTFGWPCQDNSIAGKRKGQRSSTRSGLLYEAVKIINKFKPRNFVAENVAGLLTVNKGIDIVESLKVLTYLNESCPQYDIEMQLLNTRWFLPQNRERLFFVGHIRESGSRQIFPIGEDSEQIEENSINIVGTTIGDDCTRKGQRDYVYGTNGIMGALSSTDYKQPKQILQKEYTSGNSQGARVYDPNGIATTLSSQGGGLGAKTGLYEVKSATKQGFEVANEGDSINFLVPNSKTRRGRMGKGVAQTLDTSCNQGVIGCITNALNKDCPLGIETSIRRLTPIECERLQGLPDNWTAKGIYQKQVWINKKEKTFRIVNRVEPISDSQRYKLCCNGVSIPVVQTIAERLKY